MKIFVTGSSGFIATNFIFFILKNTKYDIVAVDRTEAIHHHRFLQKETENNRFSFHQLDIGNQKSISRLLNSSAPSLVVNFAASTHVDTSIEAPISFIENNVLNYSLFLEAVLNFWQKGASGENTDNFLMINISTDEVYGALKESENPFSETNPIKPNNPYSASKAAADNISRSFFETYGLPISTVRCSNNYGPYQLPEKFIPLILSRATLNQEIPVYGQGLQRRDWLYVEDCCEAIHLICKNGLPGEIYNVGTGRDISNKEVAESISSIMDSNFPMTDGKSYNSLIKMVPDRLGHDFRYSINNSKIKRVNGWQPQTSFQRGLKKTINWYLENQKWLELAQKKISAAK